MLSAIDRKVLIDGGEEAANHVIQELMVGADAHEQLRVFSDAFAKAINVAIEATYLIQGDC